MKMTILYSILMVFSLLMLAGCSSGSGGGGTTSSNTTVGDGGVGGDGDGMGNRSTGNSGGDGNNGNDNSGGTGGGPATPSVPDEVQIAILPVASSFNSPAGFSIRWQNIAAFKRAGELQRLHINLTRSDTAMKTSHPIDVSGPNRNTYRLTGLEDGVAYRFAEMVKLEYSGNAFHNGSIQFLLETNREDNAGDGIVVGKNFDGDGRADSVDEDDDGDMVDDVNEAEGCTLRANCDGDFLADDRDIDDDGDGLIEISNAEELNAVRFVLNGTGFKETADARLVTLGCGDGRDVMECSGYELVRNISLADFINRTNPTAGWQPIAHDINPRNTVCDGGVFSGTFDGNDFEVSGLFINRSTEDCIGLFGQANGKILNVGVIVDKIIGRHQIGSLVGFGDSIEIAQSYAVNGWVSGGDIIGGLMGDISASHIIQSYAINSRIESDGGIGHIGGLVGQGRSIRIVQSYAVSGEISGHNFLGGLLGVSHTQGRSSEVIQSYAVSGPLRTVATRFFIGGLIGNGGSNRDSYWDNQTSGINIGGGIGAVRQTTLALRSPTDYTGIYDSWDDGVGVAGINDNTTIWCDEDSSGTIEMREMRNASHPRGDDNRVWDFGTASDYPALRCTGDSLTDQRAWWYLNAANKPQLNQTYLDAYLKKD